MLSKDRTLIERQDIKVGSNPEAVAVDPSAGKAYVANYKDNTVSVIKLGTLASKLKS